MCVLDFFIINDKTKMLNPTLNIIRIILGSFIMIRGLYLIIMEYIYGWPNYELWGVLTLVITFFYALIVILMKHFDDHISKDVMDIMDHLIDNHRKY